MTTKTDGRKLPFSNLVCYYQSHALSVTKLLVNLFIIKLYAQTNMWIGFIFESYGEIENERERKRERERVSEREGFMQVVKIIFRPIREVFSLTIFAKRFII